MSESGALTFLFTDIEGSTGLWERDREAMAAALSDHDEIVRGAIAEHGGHVFATGGDGVAAVFDGATDAAAAALEAQSRLHEHPWPSDITLRVRMGLHSGEAEHRAGDYFGPTLNRAARLMSIGHGGQTLCTAATAHLVEGLELVSLGVHRLRDLSAPVQVFQIGEGAFPPIRSLDNIPSNLPTVVTELVGREEELAELIALARSHRIITLTGVGGVGKTRLALALGGSLAPDFDDGCWLVELAPVADANDVVRTVAAAIGMSTSSPEVSSIATHLAQRRMFVLLDNCEHVLDATADLVDAIAAEAPETHIVATSREPLGVSGEVVRRVRSLTLPERDIDASRAMASAAVALFCERASAANDEFALTEHNVEAVVDICRRLDGIPLAIELAAARVQGMTPAEIAKRLDDRFRMLTGGRRAQERHRTLQGTVAWSYDLLLPEEREVFVRLSVFPSGFDIAAVAAVAGDLDDVAAIDALVRLVGRSLVVHDLASGRYRLLETLRQYAADRLAETGTEDAVRDAYAAHYLGLVCDVGPGVGDGRHDRSIEILSTEIDNIRATADWLQRNERWADLLTLIKAARLFLSQMLPDDMADRLLAIVEHGTIESPADDVEVSGLLGMLLVNAMRLEEGMAHASRSIDLAASHGIRPSLWAHFSLAISSVIGGTPDDEGLRHADALVEAATAAGDEFMAICGLALSVAPLRQLGREDECDERIAESFARATRLGNATAVSVALVSSVSPLIFGGTTSQRQRARRLMETYSEQANRAFGGLNMAWVRIYEAYTTLEDAPERAVALAIDGSRIGDRAGSTYPMCGGLEVLAMACARLGYDAEARAVAAYIDSVPDGRTNAIAWGRMLAERRAAIDALPPAPAEPPRTRRELMALLGRIEGLIAAG